MIFLDPRSDIAFKKLFGDITHKNILMSFLNSVLGRSDGAKIVGVVMNNTNNTAETPQSKTSIVDVRCTDQDGNQYIIEMQIVTQKDYAARAQYYSALALSRQLAAGEKYDKLVPVIFVGILDFKLFVSNANYLSHHLVLDRETYSHDLKHLEFHFIELEKFNLTLDRLTNILEKWIYFLKHAVDLQRVPDVMQDVVIKEAFDVLAQSNWSKSELEVYDKYLDAARSTASQLDTAELRGELRGRLEVAKKLLGLHGVREVSDLTGLTIEQVEELKK